MDSDEEDFVFYGTPIQREEDVTSRKKKSIAEAAGQLRSVVPWKQEVLDDEGRRRFHGAFTGGFSAGYYNTVGSKEGWTPQTFTSSRKNRAEVKSQSILNFLDDDEKAEIEGQSLGTSLQFDTFGFTSAELARKQAEKEQQDRPSAIPGLVPDELILPVANSIGVKLLRKMGWRHGQSIKDSRTNSLYGALREARKAFLAFSSGDAEPILSQFELNKGDHEGDVEPSADGDVYASQSTPVFVLNPKQDMHGLGYDPFKHAPEFRERKRLRVSGNREPGNRRGSSMKENLFSSKSGKIAPGFGIGALEELDTEDEDIYASGFDFEETHVQEIEEPSRMLLEDKKKLGKTEQGVLPGFKVASTSDYQLERCGPPVIPDDFEPYHKFSAPLEIGNKLSGPPPPEVPPPEENDLRLLIEGFAALVARCGKLFEDLSREKNKKNPLFSFLDGGKGHDYYARKLWEEQQKRNDQTKQQVYIKSMPNEQKMTAESRGKILGERPLERSSKDSSSSVVSADVIQLQFNLSDTFTTPASISEFPEAAKPFKADPEKQERFERFLKEKYYGGLRTTHSGGSSKMSEADRAREKLDFEAAAEAIQKGGGHGKLTELPSNQQFWASLNTQFTSGGVEQGKIPQGEEQMINKMYPKREEYQWRPSSLLCKRFDIIDPYMGKPPPLPRAKSRIDSLIFTPDFVKPTKSEETAVASTGSLFVSKSEEPVITEQKTSQETAIEPNTTNVERPVDLYKAIFSDDSDDEGESSTFNHVEDTEKKTEVANTTLNRLIAGDFLESLGKELGLEVPPEAPITINKVGISASPKETISTSADVKIPSVSDKPSSTPIAFSKPLADQEAPNCNLSHPEIIGERASDRNELKEAAARDFGNNSLVIASKGKKTKTHSRRDQSGRSPEDERSTRGSRHHRSLSSTSSEEDETTRKRSRRHRSRSSSSDTDSDDHGYRKHSRKSGKRSSSRGKSGSSSSKKHSKHRSRKEESPNRSFRRGSGKEEHSEDRKRSRKSSEREKDYSASKSDSHKKYR
ncbi:SWAP/Surp [Macleaya cordata]|uniref:SWAP/Surp n=1 Tax=Macleaya cordata TaxID=56857 RepID=A0A200Q3N1_MACCD|nr:SWAP/Surp [Macleaya cordata]